MKKDAVQSTMAPGFFDYPAGERSKLEMQIIQHALERWCKKQRARNGVRNSGERNSRA
jgi:hypothetical protein